MVKDHSKAAPILDERDSERLGHNRKESATASLAEERECAMEAEGSVGRMGRNRKERREGREQKAREKGLIGPERCLYTRKRKGETRNRERGYKERERREKSGLPEERGPIGANPGTSRRR
jgi:hypothetical protein